MKKTVLLLFVCLKVFVLNTCAQSLYSETYRPQYHFSPRHGWIGDPSGLVYYQGKYHMFWWGKVVSKDLVHYDEISSNVFQNTPENIANFTGSMVIDKDNTAAWGRNSWIAALTVYEKDSRKQAQGIAFSHDGERFYHYDNNPVLDLWSTEFRDPIVFWYAPTHKWIMVVAKARQRKVAFYSSSNMKNWDWESDFGPAGDSEKAWECPDLFQIPIEGSKTDKRWVLVTSINWNQEQYFVGDFDGHRFTLEPQHPTEPLLVDHGLDYYASRTFRDYDGTLTQPISIGWIDTWDYAQQVPSSWGKGFWSIPRIYRLKALKDGTHRLTQQPIDQLMSLRGKEISRKIIMPAGISRIKGFMPDKNVYELDVTFDVSKDNTFGLLLCKGHGHKTMVSYDTQSQLLLVDRTNSSDVQIPKFNRIAKATVQANERKLRLHIFVDQSSIEIFAGDGEKVFTLLTYAGEDQTGVELFALKSGTKVNFTGWELKSIWDRQK